MYGFTYNGIHSRTYGCYFVPSAIERGSDMSSYIVTDIDLNGRDGGYYIGNEVNPRDFSQDCFVEEITPEQREGLFRWLDRNTSGRLVFDHRPHMYYDVRPTKRIEIMQYTHTDKFGKVYSGTFTAIFRAYDPFGKLFRKAYGDVPTQMEKLETGMVSTYEMPWKPTTQSRDFLLYNCGTERAHTIIQIAGSATNMTIENKTTGQKCIINELRANDIPAGSYLEINSETEQVWLVKGEDKELAFYYHDMGYITLAPCVPFYGTMYVHFTLGSKEMRADGGTSFAPYMAGQYLMYYSNGVWFKIERVQDSKVAFLDREATRTAYNVVKVAPMNEILIYGTGINLSKLEIDYIPRIR